jgi:lysozyme family protein
MTTRTTFDRSLAHVLKEEGGYVNDPVDRGGATNFGVTQRVYDAYRARRAQPQRSVRDIEQAEVADIYERQYWREGKCHEMPWPAALAHFDACVNTGVFQANKLLQRALGVKDDGVLGLVSMGALAAQSVADPVALALRIAAARLRFYVSLTAQRPEQIKFLRGWVLRTVRLLEAMVPR